MDWQSDLPSWSLPNLSRQIELGAHRWHIQESGSGQLILLLPGSGSSVHTWRQILPHLSQNYHVVALDLTGQGFTQCSLNSRSGLDEMTADLVKLADNQNWHPKVIIGHSAGAAIALKISTILKVDAIVGINPALDNFKGVAGWLFPLIARALALNPLTARVFCASATANRARKLIEGTGSTLSEEGLRYYGRLIQDRTHVNGTLNMMARWSLNALIAELPRIDTRALFLVGSKDLAVPPAVAFRSAKQMQCAVVRVLEGVGHLAHEEQPQRVLSELEDFLSQQEE